VRWTAAADLPSGRDHLQRERLLQDRFALVELGIGIRGFEVNIIALGYWRFIASRGGGRFWKWRVKG
jgi:hypothetical protein